MSAGPELSVVIPCRNVALTLAEQLEALSRQRVEFDWEVVVVDNGSSDSTAEIARHFGDRLSLRIVQCARSGVNAARNSGVRSAAADLVAICDGDDVVADGWLAAMHGALQTHDYVTGPIELDMLNSPLLAASRGRRSAGRAPVVGSAFAYARGCNMGVRRPTLAEVGWFAEDTPCLDDQELGLRMHVAGVPLHFEPQALVHYRYRTEVSEIWRQGVFYGSARVPIYVAARRSGLSVPGRVAGWRSWAWMVIHLPAARTRSGRLALLWVLANRLGQVRGSVRHRTVYL